MIQVTRKTNGTFTIKVDVPEQVILRKIAEAYSIPIRTAMGSCVLRGMESISKLILHKAKDKEDDSPCDDIC